ncbi:MAG TPA: shikimate dehydrogenase [Burkholderiales bacterium]|nr:shikimate dehydrogenase [Burkholderiales bacterium]
MTDRYAVIGNPISHSKSPMIHTEFARQTGQDIVYTAILATTENFVSTVLDFLHAGGKGMNVTVPFKEQAWKYLATDITNRAIDAEAVNTLDFRDNKIIGDNTDGAGLLRDIQNNLGFPITGKRVLLMGAGGAAHGVMTPLLYEKPEILVIANRTLEKANQMVAKVQQHASFSLHSITSSPYSNLAENKFDIVINATSSSLSGELPPLPEKLFASNALAYDLMYGGGLTPFLRFAQAQGAARLADGLGMLVEQAAESFYFWRGVRPDTRPVIAKLKGKE